MSLAIWKNFPHIGLMDNIKNTFWVHPHQDKTAVGEVKRVNQGIHLPYQILLSRCLLGYFTCCLIKGLMKLRYSLTKIFFRRTGCSNKLHQFFYFKTSPMGCTL
ncbi:Uncharacterised protein [Mycobacterium tuberculosis]|nr:Uncharacterised protein [Mycobacterium tuberculosis]